MCVCVCVCVCARARTVAGNNLSKSRWVEIVEHREKATLGFVLLFWPLLAWFWAALLGYVKSLLSFNKICCIRKRSHPETRWGHLAAASGMQ